MYTFEQVPDNHADSDPSPLSSESLPSRSEHVQQDAHSGPKQEGPEIHVYTPDNVPSLEKAAAIGAGFHKIYQHRHPCESFDDPQLYVDEIKTGKVVGLVVDDEYGNPVAHGAIMMVDNQVAELCRLYVDSGAQGQNYSAALQQAALRESQRLYQEGKLKVVFTEAVTTHPVTQRMFGTIGYEPTGILDRQFSDFFGSGYRETCLRMSNILEPEIKKHRDVYLPEGLEEVADVVYKHTDCDRTIHVAQKGALRPAKLSRTLTVDDAYMEMGSMVLTVAPSRKTDDIMKDVRLAIARGADHVSVRVDIQDPGSVNQAVALLEKGFYFSIIESYPDGEYLVLQRLADNPDLDCAPDVPPLFPASSQELLEAIRLQRLDQ